ncbi:MAG TPA: hypothetical protein VI298_08865 [Geobacteraceae bacterium]
MKYGLTRVTIAAVLICCTSICAPLAIADESTAPKFPYEKAKKVLFDYLRKTDEKNVFIFGYRMVSSSEAEMHYLIRNIYVGPMKALLLNTDSGRRWYIMANPPLPLE